MLDSPIPCNWLRSIQLLRVLTVVADQPLDFDDIRQTGDEAQRLLRDLEKGFKSGAQASIPSQATPHTSKPATNSPNTIDSSSQQPTNPVPFIVIFSFIGYLIIAIILNVNKSTSVDDSVPTLSYRASCGSKYSTSGRWWPVLGPSSKSVLSRVKRDFCGDAYLNAEGAVQVASFGTRQAADDFSKLITDVMKVPFRVGRSK